MTILQLESVTKTFRQGFWGSQKEVLTDLTFSLEKGEVFGFLGHNGAGKSTTIKLILGLIRPNSGRIQLFGSEGVTTRDRSRIGYLSEEIGLYPHLNAVEMLNLVGELFRLPRSELTQSIRSLLDAVGLSDSRAMKIKHYSKGMRQRLGIATALINDPEFLLLDEPYSGLDPVGRKQLRELLLSLKSRGKTILLSSHIVPDVEAVCDRVGILSGGQIGRCLDLNDVYVGETNEVEVTVSGVSAGSITRDGRAIEKVMTNSQLTIVRCKGPDKLKSLIADVYQANGAVLQVRPLQLGLEDIFVQAISEQDAKMGADNKKTSDELIYTK